MKWKILIIIALFLSIVSCSTEEAPQSNNDTTTNYFPLTTGNYWTYDIESESISERDSLYVGNDTIINSKVYKKLKTQDMPFGFFSNALNNNGVRAEGNSILLSGNSGLDLVEEIPIDLNLNDFVIFDSNAVNNSQLSAVSGVIEQDFDGFPLKLEYTLKSTAGQSLASYTTNNGIVYSDVKEVIITLNLKISATITIPEFPIPFTIVLLNPQDALVSNNYYANNIGMFYNKTTLSYELADLSQFEIMLPIPQSSSQTQEGFLDDYFVD